MLFLSPSEHAIQLGVLCRCCSSLLQLDPQLLLLSTDVSCHPYHPQCIESRTQRQALVFKEDVAIKRLGPGGVLVKVETAALNPAYMAFLVKI